MDNKMEAPTTPAAELPRPGGGMGSFTLLWLGQMVSSVGSGLTSFALGVQVFLNTGSITRFALVSLAMVLPLLVLSPLAGTLADRWDRRRLLLASNVGSALFSLLLFFLIRGGGEPQSWLVLLIVAANAGFNAFVWPTLTAVTTLMVDKVHYGRASGLIQMGASLSRAVAPAMAGMLLVAIGLRGVILIDFATFLFAALVLLVVRIPAPVASAERKAAAGVGGNMALAWGFIRERRGLMQLLWLFAAVNFCVGVLPILLAPLVLGFSTPVMLGLVMSFATFGMMVGGSVMTVWGGNPKGQVVTILWVLLAQALLLMLGGLRPSVSLVAMVAFLFQFGFPLLLGSTQAVWQSKTPPDIQGRVFAVRRMIVGSMVPLAMVVAGPLADFVFEPLLRPGGALAASVGRWIGVGAGRGTALLFIVLGLIMLLAVVAAWRSRALRRLEEELPDVVADSAEAVDGAAAAAGTPPVLRWRPLPAAALLAGVVLVAAAAVWLQQRVPAPVAASAPATEFSAERAMRDVEHLASAPRPTGSVAHRAAGDYLLARLQELGLDSELQEVPWVESQGNFAQVVTVRNVLGRLRGQQGAPAVLLMAHYDTVPHSPGAGDDASGVATLLETARAMTAGPAPAHDLIFLFTDLEEAGLHGARAFVRQHPWAQDVAVALNFEARGHGGPVYMFQTGPRSGWWLPQFLAAAPHPVANSLMDAIYRRLPNETDLTTFLRNDISGFNFAFVNGLTHYHTRLDRPQDLQRGSVQHEGSYALALARHFTQLDLTAVDAQAAPRAYFNVLGNWVVHYSQEVAWGSALLVLVLFPVVAVAGVRRGCLSGLGLTLGTLGFFALLVGVPVLVTLVWFLLRDLVGVPMIMNGTEGAGGYMIALSVLTAALTLLLYRFFRRTVRALDLAMGALFWWWLGTLLTTFLLAPETNFLFVWPLFGALLGMAFLCLRQPEQAGRSGWVLALTALPGLLIGAPFVALLYVAMQGLFQLGGVAPLLVVLLLGLLLPHLEVAAVLRRLPELTLALAIVGLALMAAFGGSAARVESVVYAQDIDHGVSRWYSLQPEPTAWARTLGLEAGKSEPFTQFLPRLRQALPSALAPAANLVPPQLEVLDAAPRQGGGWRYRLRLVAAANSRGRLLWFEPAPAALQITGQPVALAADAAAVPLLIQQLASQGGEIAAEFTGETPAVLTVVEQREGLPELPGLAPRPDGWVPQPFLTLVHGDTTLVRRSFTLPVELPAAVAAETAGGS